jgi:mannose-1-phosphate guanylyltransferase
VKDPAPASLPPAVVLCGGFGTRLRPAVDDRPKVLAPVEGRPFLDYLLARLARQGCTDVVLSTGYLGEMVEAFAGDGAAWGLRVRYAHEPAPLGTGGALRFAADSCGLQQPFVAMNGDTLFTGSLARLTAFHAAQPGARATLALVQVPDAARYGTVRTDAASGAVTAFVEKAAATGPAWINAGVYVLDPALLAAVPRGRNVSLERDVFPAWIGKGLSGCPFPDAAFLDIGTPEDYARAAALLRK